MQPEFLALSAAVPDENEGLVTLRGVADRQHQHGLRTTKSLLRGVFVSGTTFGTCEDETVRFVDGIARIDASCDKREASGARLREFVDQLAQVSDLFGVGLRRDDHVVGFRYH